MNEPALPSGKELRQILGLPSELPFRDEAPPRPADVEQIRALHRGELPESTAADVRGFTTRYREWHDAEREVLLELLQRFQPNAGTHVELKAAEEATSDNAHGEIDEPTSSAAVSPSYIENSISGDVAPKQTERRRRMFGFKVVAVTVILAVGLLTWFGRNGEPELIAQLDDAFGPVGTDRAGNIHGLDSYPTMWRDELAAMVQGGVVHVPDKPLAFLDRQRGDNEPTMYIQPVATVTKSATPTFEWKPRGAEETYRVTIYRNGQQVAQSNELDNPSWQCTQELERGDVYAWDVVVHRGDQELVSDEPRAEFKVLEADKLEEITHVEKEARGSHLVLTVTYMQFGLLDDAERELGALVNANPDSKLAEKLLKSIQTHR